MDRNDLSSTTSTTALDEIPGSKLQTRLTPTVEDVASHAGVSRQTVSNVMNAPARVRPETITRVRASIDVLGYRANRHARNLRTGSSNAIGYRLPPLAGRLNSVMDTFLHEFTEAVEALGYRVLLFTSPDTATEIATFEDLAAQSAVDGVIFAGTERCDPRPQPLIAARIPFVSFGRTWGDHKHSWVDVDGRAGTRKAIKHLLASGHSRFAWLGTDHDSVVGEERASGVRDTLRAAGIPDSDLHLLSLTDDATADRAALSNVLDLSNAPTAFVAMSDVQAISVLTELESRCIVAGRDAAVIGFDDSPIATYAGGGLTTIRQPITFVARELARILAQQLTDPSSPTEGILVEPELVVRQTG
jgi:DNA-binding LacI/PurR family transcriptional regulator